jgi:hypothetical protein
MVTVQRAMITSVTIEGFKSFGSPAKPVILGPLNFIVGANASGKTNFVSALRFLHLAMTDGLERAVSRPEFGGPWGIRNHMLFSKKNNKKPLALAIRVKGPFSKLPLSETDHFDSYPEYRAPKRSEKPAGKAKLLRLCRERSGPLAGLEDREMASRAGSRFDPACARNHSTSFDYFWARLTAKIETLRASK